MKWNGMTQKENLLFIECALVFAFLLVPPLFSSVPFTLPPKPEGLYAQCVFCFYTVYAAAYEEVLYRLYTPNLLNRIYAGYIEPRLRRNYSAAEPAVQVPLPFLSKHVCWNITTETLDNLFLTEFPALLLFTLAHRYLGLSSMLFAAGAGIVFRHCLSQAQTGVSSGREYRFGSRSTRPLEHRGVLLPVGTQHCRLTFYSSVVLVGYRVFVRL